MADQPPSRGNFSVPQPTLVKRSVKIKSTPRTPQLSNYLNVDVSASDDVETSGETLAEPFTEEQLRTAWNTYAEQRKKFQAEYQMLSQPYRIADNLIVVELISPLHETMLNNIKSELTGFLREQLRNHTIQVSGEVLAGEDKKIIYTNREKFDFLVEKNPILRELRDRLGLDTDF